MKQTKGNRLLAMFLCVVLTLTLTVTNLTLQAFAQEDPDAGRIQVSMTHSSGISQYLDSDATDIATAAFPNAAVNNWIDTPIIVDFPTGANITKKTIVVSFAHGFQTSTSNSGADNADLIAQLDGINYTKPVEYDAPTKLWPDRDTTLADGDVTYHLNNTVSTTTIPLKVQFVANYVGMLSIGDTTNPAFRVETWADTDGDGITELLDSTQLTNVTTVLSYPNFFPSQNYQMKANTDTDVYMLPATGSYYAFRYNNVTTTVGYDNDYAKWYLSAPEHAELVGLTKTSTPLETYEDLGADPDNPGNELYCITIERARISNRDLTPIWNFPSEYFSGGDTVVISTKKVVMKPWGMDREYVYVPGTVDTPQGTGVSLGIDPVSGYEQILVEKKSLNSTHTYLIDSGNLAWVNLTNGNSIEKPDDLTAGTATRTVNWRNDGFEDNIGILGAYSIGNRKAEDTNEKTVEFHFDSTDIEVTALTVPMPAGTQLTEVWYKSETTTEWTHVTLPAPLSPPESTAENDMGVVLITNNGSLGLPIDEAITDFKYDMPSIPATKMLQGEVYSTLNYTKATYIYGRAVSKENKIVESTIRVYDKDMTTEELAANNEPSKDTSLGIIQTELADTAMTLALTGGTTNIQSPGTTFSFSNATTFSPAEKPVFSPIFYIRDETKCGINDVRLTNSRGIDLMTKYGLTAVLDHTEEDGTKVYKIDTSEIANQTTADKYDAAVGVLVSNSNPMLGALDSNNLVLRYTVTVPVSYWDDSVKHSNSERIYISTNEETTNFSRVVGTVIGDPHDVDGISNNNSPALDGNGNPQASEYPLVVVEHLATDTYYQIYTPAELNVITEAKHTKAPDESYQSWVESEDPLQVNVGTDGGFNIRISWSNDSANKISDVSLYQPIPKQGEDWGTLSSTMDDNGEAVPGPFKWSVDLKEALTGYDTTKYTVYYGIGITPTDSNTALSTSSNFYTADEVPDHGGWNNVNCIKIITNPGVLLEGHEKEQFIMNCTVPEYLENVDQTTNIFKATHYNKRIDDANNVFADWYEGSPTAIQLCRGSLEGDVYLDVNENGSLDIFEQQRRLHVLDGAKISLYKVNHGVTPVQETIIDENGHYEFHDLYRGEAKYCVVITLPTGEMMAQYNLSIQDTDFDENGLAHHMFEYKDPSKTLAEASNLWATEEPGRKEVDQGLNGIYNILLTDNTICSVSIKKLVTGNFGDRTKEFTFTIVLKDADDAALTGMFGYIGIGGKENYHLTFDQNGMATVTLKHGQGIKLLGLPSGTAYSVTENEANQNGYTTIYDGKKSGIVQTDANQNPETVITNNNDVVVPTGILLEVWPYLLIVVLALIGAIVFLSLKKRK